MSEGSGDKSDTGAVRHGDGQPARLDIGRSIRPGVPVPATVLIADMGNGALLLQGWRAGPSAYLTAEDAMPLRQVLETAFGSEQVITETTAGTDDEA